MQASIVVLVRVLLIWAALLAVGLLARLSINPRTIRRETALRGARMVSGLSGRELFARINSEYGNIFRLDYTADGYGKVEPTVGHSRLSFSLGMFRRNDYGTVCATGLLW